MRALKDWLTNFLSGREGCASPQKKEEALNSANDLIKSAQEKYQVPDEFQELCSLIEQYIGKVGPTVDKNQGLVLDQLSSKLFDLLASVALIEKEARTMMQNTTNLLQTLVLFLRNKYRKEDYTRILWTIEVMTRGLSLTWAAPYVSHLTKDVLSILLTANQNEKDFLYSLRIMINLLFNNRILLNIIARSPNFRDASKRLYTLFSESNCDHEVTALNLHLSYLIDRCIKVRSDTEVTHIKLAFCKLQELIESATTFEHVVSFTSSLHHLTLCFNSYVQQIEKENQEKLRRMSLASEPVKEPTSSTRVKSITTEILGIVSTKIFPKCLPKVRDDKGQIILQSLMELIMALCPSFIPPKNYNDLWDNFVKLLNEVSSLTSSKAKIHNSVLEVHLYLVERMLKANPNNFRVDSFSYALTNCQILLSTTTSDLARNNLTMRLMNDLNTLVQLRKDPNDTAVQAKTSRILKEETMKELLTLLLSSDSEDILRLTPSIDLSTCVVEILNIMSKHGKKSTTFIENLQNQKTWMHMANCILNGNVELMNQAFALMNAVGFSQNCRAGVANMVVKMRELPGMPQSSTLSVEPTNAPSSSAIRGMKTLDNHLEMLEQNENQDGTINDVIAWHKLKNDMHEMEMAQSTEHIYHLNRTITNLKLLLNKQAELVAKRSVTSSTMQKDYNDLKKQLAATTDKKIELEKKHIKALEALNEQVVTQEGMLKKKTERILKMEQDYRALKEQNTKLEASNKEVTQSSSQLTKEKRKLQERLDEVEKEWKQAKVKINTLEDCLKKTEDAKNSAEELLEAERRKTEIIQQVLGSRAS